MSFCRDLEKKGWEKNQVRIWTRAAKLRRTRVGKWWVKSRPHPGHLGCNPAKSLGKCLTLGMQIVTESLRMKLSLLKAVLNWDQAQHLDWDHLFPTSFHNFPHDASLIYLGLTDAPRGLKETYPAAVCGFHSYKRILEAQIQLSFKQRGDRKFHTSPQTKVSSAMVKFFRTVLRIWFMLRFSLTK